MTERSTKRRISSWLVVLMATSLGATPQTTTRDQPAEVRAPAGDRGRLVRLGRDLSRHHVRLSRRNGASVYDASGSNVIFPLASAPRRFGNPAALLDSARKQLGGTLRRKGDGATILRLSVVQIGSSYWFDRAARRLYRVHDPVLAWLGGTTGTVMLGRKSACIDPDGSCTNGAPSYLGLVARPTHPSHLRGCSEGSDPVCHEFHSFMNTVDLGFLRYARHGANSRFTSGRVQAATRVVECPASDLGPALPVTRLDTYLETGGDDLRDSSHAFMTVTLSERPGLPPPPSVGALPRVSLNNGAGLAGGSQFRAAPVAIPAGTLMGHISTITITHESVQRNVFDTRDNWNMNVIIVNAVTSEGSRPVLSARADPVHRFTGEQPSWSRAVTVAPGEPQLCVSEFPGRRLSVEGGTLFGDQSLLGGPAGLGFVALGTLVPASATGVDAVETAHSYFGLGLEATDSGSIGPGTAPEDAVFESVGICARHRTDTADGTTGNGRHPPDSCR